MPIRYKFGGSAPAYYNAEAQKTQQWRSAVAPALVTGILGVFQGATPQYVDPPQPQTFHAAITQPVPTMVAAAEYTFGIHAAAIYNAEALKSQVWDPAFPPVGVALLGDFQATQEQQQQPPTAWIETPNFRPLGAGLLGDFQATQEQQQQFPTAWIETPTFNPQGNLITQIVVARQDSPEPFAQVRASLPAAAVATSGFLAKFQYVAEQPNYVSPTSWTAPQPVPIPSVVSGAQYIFGTHNQGIYDAEARKVDFWIIPTGGTVAPVVPASTYQFGTHAAAIYNAEALKSLTWDPALPPSTIQSYIIQILDERPQDFDGTPKAQHWRSARATPGVSGLLGEVQYVQEQQYYINTAWIETPMFNPQGNLILRIEVGAQDFQQLPALVSASALAPPAPPVPIIRAFTGAPFAYDPTLPAVHWRSLRTPPPPQPIVRAFVTPQQADISANGTVYFTPMTFTGAVIPPPPFFPMPNVVGLYWYHASHVLIENDLFQTLPPKKVFSKVYPHGIVLVQDPPAGTFVLPDTAVLLTVSTREHLVGATFDVIPWWV